MKNSTTPLSRRIVALFLLAVMLFGTVACGATPTLRVTGVPDEISFGETFQMEIDSGNELFTLSVDHPELLTFDFNYKASVPQAPAIDTPVTITAALKSDPSVKATKIVVVKAPEKPAPTISIGDIGAVIRKNDAIAVNVTVENADNAAYTLTVSDPNLLTVGANNILTVRNIPDTDTVVTITATLNADNSVKAEKTITVKALSPSDALVTVTSPVLSIAKGDTVQLTVKIENSKETAYTWTTSVPEILTVNEQNQLVIVKEPEIDTVVTVKATLNNNQDAYGVQTIIVKAPVIEGQVGRLTSEALAKLGNASITVTGVLTDVYTDLKNKSNSATHKYDFSVLMADGAWNGTWYIQGAPEQAVTDCYRRGDRDNVVDQYDNVGHVMEKIFINKNNEVARKSIKDYMSVETVWEAQHLWNHLGNLKISKFSYDASAPDRLNYAADQTVAEDAYLMTYLSYSLTPMLEDTLVELTLLVDASGNVTGLIAQTEILYYGSDTNEDADALSYSTIELTFSNIGTTTVPDPAVYEAPEHADLLTAAIEKMQKADNYTYALSDVTTYAPSSDDSDYYIDSVNTANDIRPLAVGNYTSSTGKVGQKGYVTKTAILNEKTGQYSYTMDGKSFHTEYSGFRQFDGYYEEFAWGRDGEGNGVMIGTKHVAGDMFDMMPKFNFSANVFTCSGSTTKGGKTYYTFVLNETTITRDIAMEVSAYSYARDAQESTQQNLKIVVDQDGNMVSVTYPYSLIGGTYSGYCTTEFSNFGTTVLDADLFEGYIPRKVMNSWSDYTTKYYSSTHSTRDSHEEATDTVFAAIYGEDVKDLPSPAILLGVFGDNISGPFYDWKNKGTEENPVWVDWVELTARSTEFDENSMVTNYDEMMEQLTNALENAGFVKQNVNCGNANKTTRYMTFVKGRIQIVIENNYTKNFWIYFYKDNEFSMKK